MRTRLLFSICAAVALCWLPFEASGDVTHSCTFSLADLTRSVEQVHDTTLAAYSYMGLYPGTRPGQPMLPSRRVTLAVPYNATAFTVTVTDSTATDTIETLTVKPMPQPRPRNEADGDTLVFDASIYNTNSFFPASSVMLGGDGYYLGEHHQLSLEVYPMRWNPVTGQLRRYTSLSFTVTWTTSEAQAAQALVRNNPQARQESIAEAQAMVANPGQVAAFAPPAAVLRFSPLPEDTVGHEEPGYGGELSNDWARYMIITVDSLKHAMRKIAALKRQKGYSVEVRTVAEILADTTGDMRPLPGGGFSYIKDDAGKLRQYLRNAYLDKNTEYVLMAGKDVPFRYGYMDSQNANNYAYVVWANIPTDWYFSDLNTNWNLDNDTVYGEYLLCRNGNFDMNPELYVGRLQFETNSDIDNYFEKLLKYELNPGNGNSSYLERVLETVSCGFHNGDSLCAKYNQAFATVNMLKLNPNDFYPDGNAIIQDINNTGYGLLSISGHGIPFSITTNTIRDNNNAVYCSGIYGIHSSNERCLTEHDGSLKMLTNRYYPNIAYVMSCKTTPFDVPFEYENNEIVYYPAERNLGQVFTLEHNKGGVAYIGNTRECRIGKDNLESPLLAKKFAEQIAKGIYHIGKTEALSKKEYTQNIDVDALVNNLMGDPEFEIWTKSLTPYNAITVNRTDNSITVSGFASEDSLTTVSYCSNTSQGQIRTQSVNNSVTFLNIDPNSIVMVRSHGKLPYVAPLVLQNTNIQNSQYVIANDVVASRSVDAGRTAGDVTVKNGAEYEIEYKGSVTLGPGFKVEKGATFIVKPSEY